jgi:uncharacterized UBP type Zn finger protein
MPAAIHHLGDLPSVRPCDHIPASHPIKPHSAGCLECQAYGDGWVGLCLCLSCGWVACSDDSPNQHAKAHYEETDHPVVVRLPPKLRRRWCYVHQRAV